MYIKMKIDKPNNKKQGRVFMKKNWTFTLFLLSFLFTVVACGDTSEQIDKNKVENQQTSEEQVETKQADAIEDRSGKVPLDLKVADNPAFPVGSKVKIYANHMDGMEGAEGVVVGAYDTTAYSVSFRPTDGGEEVKHYKWVIHEELEGASGDPMEPGRELVINTEHIPGMRGASATIETAEEGPVYMVDFTTTTGEEVKNYKWLVEGELVAP